MRVLKTEEEIRKNWKGDINIPILSICCITYNQEKYIKDAIESFLIQETDFPFEILIHDDASTDRTADIVREYESQYPNIIKPIYQTENQYVKYLKISQKFLFPIAKGKFIAMCEGDDYWISPQKLQKQIDFMSKHQNCSMVFHRAKIERYGNISLDNNSKMTRSFGDTGIFNHSKFFFEGGSSSPTASLFFKREVINKLPKFCSLSPVGDMPLKLLCSLHGEIGYIDEVLSVRRIGTPGSWNVRTRLQNQKQNDYLNAMILMLEEFNRYSSYRWKREVEKKCVGYAHQMNKIGISPFVKIKCRFPDYYQSLNIKEKLKVIIKGILKK